MECFYTIETNLQQYIHRQMALKYGSKWCKIVPNDIPFRKRPLEASHFYTLENYLRVYLHTPQSFILSLRKLYPIRNTIAHCHQLTNEQYQTLETVYDVTMNEIYSATY